MTAYTSLCLVTIRLVVYTSTILDPTLIHAIIHNYKQIVRTWVGLRMIKLSKLRTYYNIASTFLWPCDYSLLINAISRKKSILVHKLKIDVKRAKYKPDTQMSQYVNSKPLNQRHKNYLTVLQYIVYV